MPASFVFTSSSHSMRSEGYRYHSDTAYDSFVRDAQLLMLVFTIAGFVHAFARTVYARMREHGVGIRLKENLYGLKENDPDAAPLLSPKKQDTTGMSVHDRLAAQGLSAKDLLSYSSEHIAEFSLSNLVFAIYRCGKLQVTPCEKYNVLLEHVQPSVQKLKARGATHVLWGIARVQPKGFEALIDELCGVVAMKIPELRAVDCVCALWAAAELSEEGTDEEPSRLDRVLGSGDGILLDDFGTSELVSVLAAIAGAKVQTESAFVSRAIGAILPSQIGQLSLPEQAKLVKALRVLGSTSTTMGSCVDRTIQAVADIVVNSTDANVGPVIQVLSTLPRTVGLAPFETVARHAMDTQFNGLDAKQLLALAVCSSQAGLSSPSEFYLELADALRSSGKLKAADEKKLHSAFASVGLEGLL